MKIQQTAGGARESFELYRGINVGDSATQDYAILLWEDELLEEECYDEAEYYENDYVYEGIITGEETVIDSVSFENIEASGNVEKI